MDEPTKASRPFDRDRDGLIPSGGAAALVLEDYDHAIARGAKILCELTGYGFSSNGGGISQPSDDGSVIAMSRAMKDAGLELDDIDYINAHATSTHQGDMFEAIALDRMFHGQRALISSTKSMTGHDKDYYLRESYSAFGDGMDQFKRFDGGLRMGVGIQYDLFYADLTYDLGLANIGQDDFDDTKNSAVMLNIGVNF